MRLFKPIINMMGSLKDGQKFSFIGIILGIPIVILTLLFIAELNHEINWKDERLKGVHFNKLLKDLLQDIQLHRTYSIEYIQGNEDSALQMKEIQQDILRDIEKIKYYRLEVGSSVDFSEKISQLNKQWQEIETKIEHLNPHLVTDLQNEYIFFITDFIEIIAGEYGLILAKDELTYYIINDVTKTLPALTEQLGQIRAIGIMSEGEVSDLENRQITSHISTAKRYIKELERSRNITLMTESSFDRNFDTLSVQVIEETYEFLDDVENEFLNANFNDSLEEIINHATKTINANFELYDLEINELENIMSERLKKLKLIRVLMFTFQIVALILTVYCFFGFYFSIRYTMKEVREKRQRAENKYIITQRKLNRVEKKMSQKVMMAHEEERKRVARELHDSIGQSLYSILVKLNVADQQIHSRKKGDLTEIMEITEEAMKEIKRISQTLRPGILDDFGFIPALKSFIEDYMKTYHIQVRFEFSGDKERLNPEIETQLYRICQEALTNIAKHAAAKFVNISISVNMQEIILILKDDGHGFRVNSYLKDHERKGIGLFSMKERAESLGGTFAIYSKENQGTEIIVRIPRI